MKKVFASPYASIIKGKYNKFNNDRSIGYGSKQEAKRAQELKLMERAGLISELREQVVFELAPSAIINGRKKPALRYIADFVYTENGQTIVEDSKGFVTPVYSIKRHLMKTVHGIDIRETK